eukprot:1160141-Pelagomonas_calceolata.AAC.7
MSRGLSGAQKVYWHCQTASMSGFLNDQAAGQGPYAVYKDQAVYKFVLFARTRLCAKALLAWAHPTCLDACMFAINKCSSPLEGELHLHLNFLSAPGTLPLREDMLRMSPSISAAPALHLHLSAGGCHGVGPFLLDCAWLLLMPPEMSSPKPLNL